MLLVACNRDPKPPPPAKTEQRGLGDQLAYEAAHRPALALTVEGALARFATAGVRVDDKQYLATTARARYCRGGSTAEGLGVAVCEYESEDAANAGRAHVEKMFPNVPGRHIAVHGALSVTTTAIDAGDERERAIVDSTPL